MSGNIGLSLMGLRVNFPYLGLGIASLIRAVKETGFEEIEIPMLQDELQLTPIAQAVKIMGLQVRAIHADKNLMHASPEALEYKVQVIGRFAANLNTDLIVLHPTSEWPSRAQIEILAKGFAKYKIAIENTNMIAIKWAEILGQYLECGVALDVSHAQYLGQSIDHYFSANVWHTHIRGYNSHERYTRIGSSDYKAIMELLKKEKQGHYKGSLMLEYPYVTLDDAWTDKMLLSQLRELVYK